MRKRIQKQPESKVFLTPERAAEIKKEISDLERMVKGNKVDNYDGFSVGYTPSSASMIMNKGEIVKEIREKQKTLHDFTPQKFTTKESNKAYREAKELRKELKDVLTPNKLLGLKHAEAGTTARKAQSFQQAVEREVYNMRHSQKKIERYRYLMQRIDAADKTESSIERLRK